MHEQIDIRDMNNAGIKTWEVCSDGGTFKVIVEARTGQGAVEKAQAIMWRRGIEDEGYELIPSLLYDLP